MCHFCVMKQIRQIVKRIIPAMVMAFSYLLLPMEMLEMHADAVLITIQEIVFTVDSMLFESV